MPVSTSLRHVRASSPSGRGLPWRSSLSSFDLQCVSPFLLFSKLKQAELAPPWVVVFSPSFQKRRRMHQSSLSVVGGDMSPFLWRRNKPNWQRQASPSFGGSFLGPSSLFFVHFWKRNEPSTSISPLSHFGDGVLSTFFSKCESCASFPVERGLPYLPWVASI